MSTSRIRDPNTVGVLVAVVTSAATAFVVLTAHQTLHAATTAPWRFLLFALLAFALQLLAVEVYGRGAVSVAGIGLLATGFTFGAGPAATVAVATAVVHALHRHVKPHRALYNAGTWALAAGGGAAAYSVAGSNWNVVELVGPALAAGLVFWAVNIGLLTLAMSVSENADFWDVWRERLRWLTIHYLAFGPLALASTIAYDKVGIAGLLAFAVPPGLLILSVRQYLQRTREAVEEARRANEELRLANAALESRNADLRDLFDFAAGLSAQAHDRHSLTAYAQDALERLTGARASVSVGSVARDAAPLVSSGRVVGGLSVEGGDERRWERLRDAILPQLATAIESASLVEELRKTHLETIAALSRSMEAKDYYTGGHTERVSAIAVALASRLGFDGADLAAIEIGALLHDIGKIGIPERILHKPGPLDDDEWKIMREHPVISEYILAEVDLPPIVLQIARHSHERMDGGGYPDGLSGDDIPLPARIVLVADAYDALTSDRPYRRARRPRAAMDELRAHVGTQFCPRVVDALERVLREEPRLLGGGDVLIAVA